MPTRIRNQCTAGIGQNSQQVLTAPQHVTTCVHSIYIANKAESNIRVTLKLHDVSETFDICVLNEVIIPQNTTLNLSSTLILEPGDYLFMFTDTPDSADILFATSEVSFQNSPNIMM